MVKILLFFIYFHNSAYFYCNDKISLMFNDVYYVNWRYLVIIFQISEEGSYLYYKGHCVHAMLTLVMSPTVFLAAGTSSNS